MAKKLKTIKTIKTIKDAHSSALMRAMCYNIYNPTARAYKRKNRPRASFLFTGKNTQRRYRGSKIPTVYALYNGQGTL